MNVVVMAAAMASRPLDRAALAERIQLIALRVQAKKCGPFMQRLRGCVAAPSSPDPRPLRLRLIPVPEHLARARARRSMLNMPRLRNVVPDTESSAPSDSKLLLLSPTVVDLELRGLADELKEFALAEGATPVPYTLTLPYEHFPAEHVLRKLLPDEVEVPTSFETVGHIIHLNLRAEHEAHKALIAQVLLDKNAPRIRTVVNKVDSISNEFRVFPMEVLAGDAEMVTEVKQHGCTFGLDYSKVYWNSRLEAEHRRLIGQLSPADMLIDLMAGIGPFAVPAAKKGVAVYANDLNPASYEWLVKNVERNRVRGVVCSCRDARAFARALTSSAPPDELAGFGAALRRVHAGGGRVHMTMNLPASAIEFVDVLPGLFHRGRWDGPLPTVHVYCFSKEEEAAAVDDVRTRTERVLGAALDGRCDVHVVRTVAPNKLMLCVSFQVPEEVAWAADTADTTGAGGNPAKRAKTSSDSEQ